MRHEGVPRCRPPREAVAASRPLAPVRVSYSVWTALSRLRSDLVYQAKCSCLDGLAQAQGGHDVMRPMKTAQRSDLQAVVTLNTGPTPRPACQSRYFCGSCPGLEPAAKPRPGHSGSSAARTSEREPSAGLGRIRPVNRAMHQEFHRQQQRDGCQSRAGAAAIFAARETAIPSKKSARTAPRARRVRGAVASAGRPWPRREPGNPRLRLDISTHRAHHPAPRPSAQRVHTSPGTPGNSQVEAGSPRTQERAPTSQ
jgi:hypothetical protein